MFEKVTAKRSKLQDEVDNNEDSNSPEEEAIPPTNAPITQQVPPLENDSLYTQISLRKLEQGDLKSYEHLLDKYDKDTSCRNTLRPILKKHWDTFVKHITNSIFQLLANPQIPPAYLVSYCFGLIQHHYVGNWTLDKLRSERARARGRARARPSSEQ